MPARSAWATSFGRRRWPGIDHRGQLDSGLSGIGHGLPTIVIVGEERHATARQCAEAIDIAAHRAGQHDAGQIVRPEPDRPLDPRPAASTARLATIRHSRWRGMCAGGAGR